MTTPDRDTYLTVAEVAALLRVAKMTVYRLCHANELANLRVGRSLRISEVGLRRYITQGGNDPEMFADTAQRDETERRHLRSI